MNRPTSNAVQNPAPLPLTVNIHVTRSCNYRCVCCYAGFADAQCPRRVMDRARWGLLIDELARLPQHPSGRPRKVTFSGGEPTLLPYLPDLIGQCRRAGFTTSLITNGSRLCPEIFRDLDWLGVSVDSADPNTLRLLGRCCSDGWVVTTDVLAQQIADARWAGCRIKLNTVVSRLNLHEQLGPVIAGLRADRWKLLQMSTLEGQNDGTHERYGVTETEFKGFVVENTPAAVAAGIAVVPEDTAAITGSYCMIAPNGCFFDDITGRHRYSRPILDAGAQAAFSDVYFNPNAFDARGGCYE